MIPAFHATVEQGKLKITNIQKFVEHLRSMEGEVQVIVQKPKKQRSNRQNAYYFGIVVKMIAEELGEHKRDAHKILAAHFLTETIVVKGKELHFVRSTTSLSTKEMEDYLAHCRQLGAEMWGLNIPLPNEVDMETLSTWYP